MKAAGLLQGCPHHPYSMWDFSVASHLMWLHFIPFTFYFVHIRFASMCFGTFCIEKNRVDLPGFVGVPDLLKWWFDGVGVDECVIVLMLGATVVFVAAVWFVPFVLAIFSAFASASYQNIGEMIERIKQSMFKSNNFRDFYAKLKLHTFFFSSSFSRIFLASYLAFLRAAKRASA